MEYQRKELGAGYYLIYRETTNGLGGFHPVNIKLYCRFGLLVKEMTDDLGNFIHFPGASGEEWRKDLSGNFFACTQFVCDVSRFIKGLACFGWVVQPDGFYWADEDGFGSTIDKEIVLYSLFDKKGNFIKPFSQKKPDVYNIYRL